MTSTKPTHWPRGQSRRRGGEGGFLHSLLGVLWRFVRWDYVIAAASEQKRDDDGAASISGLDLARQKVADMNIDDLLAVVYKAKAELHPKLAQFKESLEGK